MLKTIRPLKWSIRTWTERSTFPADSRTFSSKVNKGGFHAQNDGRLIAVMALAAVLSFLFINMTQKGTHKELVIQKDRAVIKRVDLGKLRLIRN